MAERSVEHLHTHYIPGKLKRRIITEMLIEQWFEWME
jgi:Fe-S cluster biosynthesis and repair protein YggX